MLLPSYIRTPYVYVGAPAAGVTRSRIDMSAAVHNSWPPTPPTTWLPHHEWKRIVNFLSAIGLSPPSLLQCPREEKRESSSFPSPPTARPAASSLPGRRFGGG